MNADGLQFSLRLLGRERYASRWWPGKTARGHFTVDLPRFKRPVRCDPRGERPGGQSMDEISIDSAFISGLLCRITDKPERRAMVDVAIGLIGNVDLGGLQGGQQFNQVAEHGAAFVKNRLAMHGSVVVLLDERVGLIFLGELLADYLFI